MKSIIISPFKHLDLRSKPDGAFFVSLLFVVGTIFGCAFGFYFCDETSLTISNSVFYFESIAEALLYSFRFVGIALFLGTSYAGTILIPLLSLIYACFIGSSVTALYLSLGKEALTEILVCHVAPSLVALPCFLVVADSMMAISKKLYFYRFYDTVIGERTRSRFAVFAAVTMSILLSTYYYYLIPILLRF